MTLPPAQHHAIATAATAAPAGSSEHDKITQQAQKWVAQTFYGELLKEMRQSPFRSEMFEGGRGGQAYASLFDQRLAEHMGKSAGNKLVRSLVRKIEANRKPNGESAVKKTAVGYGLTTPGNHAAGDDNNPGRKQNSPKRNSEGRARVATNLRA